MSNLRMALRESVPLSQPCCRCFKSERPWDRIAGDAYCPNCQESLAVGEAEPLILRTDQDRCAVCDRAGTVTFHTFPLHCQEPLEIQLCPEHLRSLLARQLGPHAFYQLQRQLRTIGLTADQVFLLHSAFYDRQGRALQPAV